ncbi:MAG: hypothetical protein JWP81_3626 [Ferruginibacter sp.]|nr:hypothetical protein [Ferruginibacter sp.]
MPNLDKTNEPYLPAADDVKEFEMLFPMLLADLKAIGKLSKMKQDASVNTLKVKAINKKLIKLKELLSKEPTIEYLDLLDSDILPSNSDAVLIMIQYKQAMEQYKAKYFTKDNSDFDVVDERYSWKTAK